MLQLTAPTLSSWPPMRPNGPSWHLFMAMRATESARRGTIKRGLECRTSWKPFKGIVDGKSSERTFRPVGRAQNSLNAAPQNLALKQHANPHIHKNDKTEIQTYRWYDSQSTKTMPP